MGTFWRIKSQLVNQSINPKVLIRRNNFQQGVCHDVALPFALKSILMQKKNYENSNN
jgi:hypothetical protein